MTENAVPGDPSAAEIRARLEEAARLVRQSKRLDTDSRQILAELVEELSATLRTAQLSPTELSHLESTTTNLAKVLHHEPTEGALHSVQEGFEQVIVTLEARAPLVAGLARRMLDALANLGI